MKKFLASVKENEVHLFLLGEGQYHRDVLRDSFEEPTNYLHQWKNEIEPILNSDDSKNFVNELLRALKELTNYAPDVNLGLYTIFRHLVIYFYFLNISKTITEKLDLSELIALLRESVKKNKESLIDDKRWSGSPGNKLNQGLGLYGIILHHADEIKNKWGGPDLLGQFENRCLT